MCVGLFRIQTILLTTPLLRGEVLYQLGCITLITAKARHPQHPARQGHSHGQSASTSCVRSISDVTLSAGGSTPWTTEKRDMKRLSGR